MPPKVASLPSYPKAKSGQRSSPVLRNAASQVLNSQKDGRSSVQSSGSSAAPASRQLTPSSVFVRIRPTKATGSGHTDGEAVSKKLQDFDDTTVTVKEDDLRKTTKFEVTKVIAPDVDQENTFSEIAPDLLDAFKSDTNVLFYAYGQTGSGKTHTMLGEIDSLSSEEPVPGWGLFPRVVHSTLESMKQWRKSGNPCVLLASAVEFYCCCAFDLNSKYRDAKDEVTLDDQAQIFGAKTKEIKSIKGLRKWISRMYANRTTAKTNMNDASSRSHCAFVLTLLQLRADDTFVKTSFSMIDMAGSERCYKTGGERIGGIEATKEAGQMMEAGTPELLSIGAQGFFINFEISMITTEILKASDCHKKGMPYKASKESSTAASFYFCACCDGRARMGACVTISQSPQHGFETWFSLTYAQQLAQCRVPLVKVKPVPIAQAVDAATTAAEEAAAKYDQNDKNPQGAKQYRVFCLQRGAANHTAEMLKYLKRMVEQKEGKEQEDSDGGVSDGPWQSPLAPRKAPVEAIEKSAMEMGKINENFSVFIRIRPLLDREVRAGASNCFAVSDVENFPRDPPPQRITVQTGDVSEAEARASFVFNRVFEDSHGQDDVYSSAAEPYVADFLNNTNVTIFAYGQTGTGKTYTIAGPSQDPGLISRCLSTIFASLDATGKELYYEYVQLYLEGFKDLLDAESKAQLKLVDGKDGSVHLQNVSSHKATSAGQVLKDLEVGATRRATRAQDMNAASSRSHAILMLRLVEPGEDASKASSSMFIVDLAGSERSERSGVTGKGFEEATSINQSLTALGRVVVSLIEQQKFIPYNSHPLTNILKTGLGGNSKTALIACVTQAADSMSESINTLRFAMQASHVKNKVAKKDAAAQSAARAAEIEDAGNTLELEGGKGIVPLPTGPLEVWGSWPGSDDSAVIVLDDLNAEPSRTQGIIDALASSGYRVLGVKLPGTTQKNLEQDIPVLLALFDWLGLAKPVIFGRDWGAIRAIRFKICHPKRVGRLVLEEFASKVDPKQYKEMESKDVFKVNGMGSFMWIWDGAYPTTADLGAGKNMNGFKGNPKPILLWPFQNKGKHDPQKRNKWMAKSADAFAKALKTTPTDSYLMTDDDVAKQIMP